MKKTITQSPKACKVQTEFSTKASEEGSKAVKEEIKAFLKQKYLQEQMGILSRYDSGEGAFSSRPQTERRED